MPAFLSERGGAALVRVRVRPRSAREGLDGEHDGALVVRVQAPPAEGKANRAACRVVARACGVPPSAVSVERGAASRDKLLRIEGAAAADLAARLESR